MADQRRKTKREREQERTRFTELYAAAQAAGCEAAARATPDRLRLASGQETEVVGFAWVVVRPGSGGFGRWLLSTRRGRPNYPGTGVRVGMGSGVALAPKEAHAVAFAAVLREAGVDAEADSRED